MDSFIKIHVIQICFSTCAPFEYNLYVKMVKNCYNFALLVNSGLMGYSMMDKNVIGKNPQIDG